MRLLLFSVLLVIACIVYVDAGVDTAYGVDGTHGKYGKIDEAFLQGEAKNVNPPSTEATTTTTKKSKGWFSWFKKGNKDKNEPTTTTTTQSTPKKAITPAVIKVTPSPVPLPAKEEPKKGPAVPPKPSSTTHAPKEKDLQPLPIGTKADTHPISPYDPKKHEPSQPDHIFSHKTVTSTTAAPNNRKEPSSPTIGAKSDFPPLPSRDNKKKEELPPVPPKPTPKPIDAHSPTSTTHRNSFNYDKQDFPALPSPNGYKKEDFPPLPSSNQAKNKNGVVPPNPPPRQPKPSSYDNPHPSSGSKVKDLVNFYDSKAATTSRPLLPSEIAGLKKPTVKITDEELKAVSEELFGKDSNNNLANYVKINYQAKTSQFSNEDKAPAPLFEVKNKELWNLPTMKNFVALLDNYDEDVSVNEYVSPQERVEENAFVDSIMSTTVMRSTMTFLKSKEIVSPDPKEQRDLVKQIWFNMYSRGQGKIGSSGFEHVFMNEKRDGKVMGFHNWIYYAKLEEKNKVNYLGYWKEVDLDSKRGVLYPVFNLGDKQKPINSFFVGTTPEYEISVYTLCFLARVNTECKVTANGKQLTIETFTFKYRSKIYVGSAFVK